MPAQSRDLPLEPEGKGWSVGPPFLQAPLKKVREGLVFVGGGVGVKEHISQLEDP